MSKVISFPNNLYIVAAEGNETKQSPLQKAFKSFENRLGINYADLTTSKEAQKIARENLDKETMRLREKYNK